MIKSGVVAVAESTHMPYTLKAAHLVRDADVMFGFGKVVHAGGVATSVLEMQQNVLVRLLGF